MQLRRPTLKGSGTYPAGPLVSSAMVIFAPLEDAINFFSAVAEPATQSRAILSLRTLNDALQNCRVTFDLGKQRTMESAARVQEAPGETSAPRMETYLYSAASIHSPEGI